MERFARSLPRMRERTAADLARRGMVRDRVLACAVRLLDLGFFRIGSERYAEENETYGLATLRRKHVTIAGGVASFHYTAKGGQATTTRRSPTRRSCRRSSSSRTATAAATSCSPTARAAAAGRDVKAAEINEYLKDVTGGDYSAKDFRTWNATVLAAVDLAANGSEATGESARKRAAAAATKRVAAYLANTPAVCRKAYIDPRVFDRYDSGETIRLSLRRMVAGTDPGEFVDRERIERAVLRLIKD